MSADFLACPRCDCLTFYIRAATEKMTFFQVTKDFNPVAEGVKISARSPADFSLIYCTGCAWSGEMKDLIAKS